MSKQSKPRSRFIVVWLLYTAILLFGFTAGAGLLYVLEPPKPPPTEPVYDVMLFQQDHPLDDFSTPLSLMNASKRMSLRGQDQLVTQASGAAFFKQAYPIWKPRMMVISNRTSRETKNYQIGVKGSVVGGKILTELVFVADGRRTKHHFSLTENELQLLVLDRGNSSNPQITYALIRAARIPAPSKAAPLRPMPKQKPKESILLAG